MLEFSTEGIEMGPLGEDSTQWEQCAGGGRALREGQCDCSVQGEGQRSEMLLHRQAEPGVHNKELKSSSVKGTTRDS